MSNSIRNIFIVLLFFFAFHISHAQNLQDSSSYVSMNEIIRQQADSMGYYFVQNDFNNYMKYQHPRLVQKLGGELTLINILNENVTKNGYQAMSVINDAPSKIIVTDTNLQCTLPQKMIMKVGNTKLEILSTLICISYDNGKKWFFINASVPSSVLKEVLPEMSSELIIQEQQTHKVNY